MADRGVASRRQCERLIRQGRVTVNGKLVSVLPVWVDLTTDRIAVDGKLLDCGRAGASKTYVVLNKPRHVICTSCDPEGRQSVVDLVNVPHRLYPVGRLDADSTGLILLTNDGALADRLTHPRYEVPKQYHVSVQGHVTDYDLERLRRGLYLARRDATAFAQRAKKGMLVQVDLLGRGRDKSRGDRSRLALTLREGQNRQIRRLLARLGYKVRRLQRVAIGPIQLKGLGVGHWRFLNGRERRMLRQVAGLEKLIASSPGRGHLRG